MLQLPPILNKVFRSLIFTLIAFVINAIGLVFLILKLVSLPFVPDRNIDNMSDYYTTVWERVQGNSVDEGRFQVVDLSDNDRRDIVEILSIISGMNPKVIGFDINCIYKDSSIVDSLLVELLRSNQNIVLPVEYTENKFLYSVFYEELKDKEYGVVSFPGTKGILRTFYPSFTSGDKFHRSFACAVAEMYGADISRVYRKNKHLINFTTLRLTDADAIPGNQFLNLNERDSSSLASEISNRIVLLGTSRLTIDNHMTPLGYNLSGVMIHAHIINALIDGKTIRTVNPLVTYFICFIMSFVLMMIKRNDRSRTNVKIVWKYKIVWALLTFLCSILAFSLIGTIIYCKCNLFIDFAPYIVVVVIWYILKDKEFNVNLRK